MELSGRPPTEFISPNKSKTKTKRGREKTETSQLPWWIPLPLNRIIIPSAISLRNHLQRSFIAIQITRTNLVLKSWLHACQGIRKVSAQSDADVPQRKSAGKALSRNGGNEMIWFERKSTQDCRIKCWLVDQLSTKLVTEAENRTLFRLNPIRCPANRTIL